MNKSIILPLLILLLLGVGAYFLVNKNDKATTLVDEDWKMAVEKPEQIHRIFLASRKGERVDLKRKGKDWIYNDKWIARPNAIENLLATLTRVDLKERPANAAVDNMIKSIAANGIKVEIYGKEDKVLKKYYVGGLTQDERGTYMIMEGSDNPYVMHLPHWEGGLRSRFFMGDKNWRDKTVFSFEPEEVEEISMEYPKNRSQSFKISRQNSKWNVDPVYQSTRKIKGVVDEDAVEEFLMGFDNLVAEAFENNFEGRDSITAIIPFLKIDLKLKDGTAQQVNLHPLDYQFKDPMDDSQKPFERYLADMNNEDKDLMLVQHLVFNKIFWSYKHFFRKD